MADLGEHVKFTIANASFEDALQVGVAPPVWQLLDESLRPGITSGSRTGSPEGRGAFEKVVLGYIGVGYNLKRLRLADIRQLASDLEELASHEYQRAEFLKKHALQILKSNRSLLQSLSPEGKDEIIQSITEPMHKFKEEVWAKSFLDLMGQRPTDYRWKSLKNMDPYKSNGSIGLVALLYTENFIRARQVHPKPPATLTVTMNVLDGVIELNKIVGPLATQSREAAEYVQAVQVAGNAAFSLRNMLGRMGTAPLRHRRQAASIRDTYVMALSGFPSQVQNEIIRMVPTPYFTAGKS